MTLLSASFLEEAGENFSQSLVPGFKFSCERQWKGKPEVVVFEAQGPVITKHLSLDVRGGELPEVELIESILPLLAKLPAPVIVSGGHTIINMDNVLDVSDYVVESATFSMKLMELLHSEYKIESDFLVQVNDLFMEDAGNEIGASTPNEYRKRSLNPYIIPTKMEELINRTSKNIGRDFKVLFCGEKNMADRFKRHVDNKRKGGDDRFVYTENSTERVWSVNVNGDIIPFMVNEKPNCVAANAAMLRSIRHILDANRVRDNYAAYVGVFPLCSMENVLNGYKVAHNVYGLTIPTYYIFFGSSCV